MLINYQWNKGHTCKEWIWYRYYWVIDVPCRVKRSLSNSTQHTISEASEIPLSFPSKFTLWNKILFHAQNPEVSIRISVWTLDSWRKFSSMKSGWLSFLAARGVALHTTSTITTTWMVVFYDISSVLPGKAWSPNTRKVRVELLLIRPQYWNRKSTTT